MPSARPAPGSVPMSGFEDAFTLLFAAWAVTGHLAFLSGVTLRHYWLLATALGAAALGIFAFLILKKVRSGTGDTGRGSVAWAAIGLGVILVLCLHRPDGDDRIYLGQQMKALDGPNESFWRMADVTAYNAGYVMSSYEYVRAGFSWLFGIPMLTSYYLLWPALIAAMAVAYQGRLLRLFGVRSLAIGFAVWFVVMLAWGDTHRTPANFGFVRMFQGKGALVSVTIPAAQYYWLRFASHGERRSLLLLYATLIAGVGFTPTGIPTGVLLAALFVVATLLDVGVTRGGWKIVAGLAGAGVYPVLMGLLMRFYFAHTPESGYLPPELLTVGATTQIAAAPTPSMAPTPAAAIAPPAGAPLAPTVTPTPGAASTPTPGPTATPVPAPTATPPPTPTPTPALPPTRDVSLVDVFLVLGSGWRARIVIACLLATTLVPRTTGARRLFAIYAILCALLLTLPATSRLIGSASYTSFAWRWVFVIPFALSTALVTERVATWFDSGWMQVGVAAAMSAAFLLASPLRVTSEANGTSFGRPHYKLPPGPEVLLLGYDKPAIREGRRLISPATGARH